MVTPPSLPSFLTTRGTWPRHGSAQGHRAQGTDHRVPGGKGRAFSLQEGWQNWDYPPRTISPPPLLLLERTPPHQEKQEAGYQIRQNNNPTVPSDWQEAQPLLCPGASCLEGNSQPLGVGHAPGSLGWALWLVPSNRPPGHQGRPRIWRARSALAYWAPLCHCLFTIPVPYLEGGSWFPWRKGKQWGSESWPLCSARASWAGTGSWLCLLSKPSIWCLFSSSRAVQFLSQLEPTRYHDFFLCSQQNKQNHQRISISFLKEKHFVQHFKKNLKDKQNSCRIMMKIKYQYWVEAEYKWKSPNHLQQENKQIYESPSNLEKSQPHY